MYKELQKKIGIKFKDDIILDQAFVHKSWRNEHKNEKSDDNERLEFLGDAVLELVVTEFLFQNYPQSREGDLTNWRSALVKGKHLSEIAKDLNLGKYLYLSKGEEQSQGREKAYILANTLEAMIGAIYLEKGYKITHGFIQKFILTRLEKIIEEGSHVDPKSQFQEIVQEKTGITPTYKVISESGPDHSKMFIVAVCVGDEVIAEGEDSSKQKAEEVAAKNALIVRDWNEMSSIAKKKG